MKERIIYKMDYTIIANGGINGGQSPDKPIENSYLCDLTFAGTTIAANPEVPRLNYFVLVTKQKAMFAWQLEVGGNISQTTNVAENVTNVGSLFELRTLAQYEQAALLLVELQMRIQEKMRECGIKPPKLWKFATADQITFDIPQSA